MVNLPQQDARDRGRIGSGRIPRSHHNWGSRYGREREQMRNREPSTVLELDNLALQSVRLMEKYNPKSNKNFDVAMDLLRRQYNLNFMIACEHCNGNHGIDELIAPER